MEEFIDSYNTFGGMKSDLFEGGHHVPCIVRWCDKLAPHTVGQTICMTDFMATFATITGYVLADNESEDSYNILPLLTNSNYKSTIREATVHHLIDGSFAIRQGKWKLLLSSYSGGWSNPAVPVMESPRFQLYDMDRDTEESHNLYDSHREIADKQERIMIDYVKNGHSTKGIPQQNDGEYPWKQL